MTQYFDKNDQILIISFKLNGSNFVTFNYSIFIVFSPILKIINIDVMIF